MAASRSKDPSTQCGAVIVNENKDTVGTGYNGLPSGVEYKSYRMERPEKYLWMEHAERNAIYRAARRGAATDGCTMYCYPGIPCVECARAIIQSGITRVVLDIDAKTSVLCDNDTTRNTVKEMFEEGNVSMERVKVRYL